MFHFSLWVSFFFFSDPTLHHSHGQLGVVRWLLLVCADTPWSTLLHHCSKVRNESTGRPQKQSRVKLLF